MTGVNETSKGKFKPPVKKFDGDLKIIKSMGKFQMKLKFLRINWIWMALFLCCFFYSARDAAADCNSNPDLDDGKIHKLESFPIKVRQRSVKPTSKDIKLEREQNHSLVKIKAKKLQSHVNAPRNQIKAYAAVFPLKGATSPRIDSLPADKATQKAVFIKDEKLIHSTSSPKPPKRKIRIPTPGKVIDAENIDKYSELFPPNFVEAFKNGWKLIKPISVTVKAKATNQFCRSFLEASENNKGRYSLNIEGFIQEDVTQIAGLPFPDLSTMDPQFPVKFMWNYEFKYDYDDRRYEMITFSKSSGKPFISIKVATGATIRFQNRMYNEPRPYYETANGIRKADYMVGIWPSNRKSGGFLTYRYVDPMKDDSTYYYIPGVRGIIKGKNNERSVPIGVNPHTLDDFSVFQGQIPEFRFKLIDERLMLVCGATTMNYRRDLAKIRSTDHLIFPTDMEIRDVYVIDITSKNKKYLQSRKRIYIDKENYSIYYGETWDRAEKLWKIWYAYYEATQLPSGDTNPNLFGMLGIDTQLGLATSSGFLNECNTNALTESQFEVASFRKLTKR